MGASLALAGASACTRQPDELIVPYVRQPENVVPGRPLFFATAMPLGGSASGLLAESHEGRPTKIEGNPDHPASLGATDAYRAGLRAAAVRSRPVAGHDVSSAKSAPGARSCRSSRQAFSQRQAVQGAGLRFLTETVGSPDARPPAAGVLAALPQAKWHQCEPVNARQRHAGARLAFGEVGRDHYRFEQRPTWSCPSAPTSSGAGPGSVRYARDFANGRRVRKAKAEMNRLYVAETAPSPTGSMADHRLPAAPVRSRRSRGRCTPPSAVAPAHPPSATPEMDKWIAPRRRICRRTALPASSSRGPAAAGRPRARPRHERGARQRRRHASSTRIPCRLHPSTRCSRCASWSRT